MARKKKPEEHVNHERWLVSYADFMTLLFAVFTAMFALSNADKEKFAEMAVSLRNAFSTDTPTDVTVLGLKGTSTTMSDSPGLRSMNMGRGGSPGTAQRPMTSSPVSGAGAQTAEGDPDIEAPPSFNVTPTPTPPGFDPGAMATPPDGLRVEDGTGGWIPRLESDLADLIRRERMDEAIEVRNDPRGLVVSLSVEVFFKPGSARVQEEAVPAFERIVALIRERGFPLIVEAHSDDGQLSNSPYADKIELTVARATQLWRYLVTQFELDPAKVSAMGYGPWRPLAPNTTEENRRRNRRVDLVIQAPPASN